MKPFTRYAAESIVCILITVGFFELILQLTLARTPEISYEKDWGIVPVSGSVRLLGTEGYGITHYLTHGEIATPFDNGAISVVVLGDSSTEALQVPDAVKFVSFAETNLRAKGKLANLHNLGESGNSIPDYIYLAPLIRQYYSPAIVVVQLNISDGEDAYNPEHLNYFIVNEKGDLELRHQDTPDSYNKLYNKLRVVLPLLGRYRFSKMLEKSNIKLNSGDEFGPVNVGKVETRMDAQLRLLRKAYSGIEVIILLLPDTPRVDESNINFKDPNYQALLESVEKIDGFYIVDPSPEFDRLIEKGNFPRGFTNSLPGQGHMNRFGHLIVGELLSEKISEIIQ